MVPETQSWREAASNVTYALSLTALMAVTLFVTVGVNPKAEGYGNLPWYYAGGSLLAAAGLHAISRRFQGAAEGVGAGEAVVGSAERSVKSGSGNV